MADSASSAGTVCTARTRLPAVAATEKPANATQSREKLAALRCQAGSATSGIQDEPGGQKPVVKSLVGAQYLDECKQLGSSERRVWGPRLVQVNISSQRM